MEPQGFRNSGGKTMNVESYKSLEARITFKDGKVLNCWILPHKVDE